VGADFVHDHELARANARASNDELERALAEIKSDCEAR
jgi:cytochrome c556